MFAIAFPNIDPILIQIGPLAVRWYALAYIAGLFGGLYYMRHLVKAPPALMKPQQPAAARRRPPRSSPTV